MLCTCLVGPCSLTKLKLICQEETWSVYVKRQEASGSQVWSRSPWEWLSQSHAWKIVLECIMESEPIKRMFDMQWAKAQGQLRVPTRFCQQQFCFRAALPTAVVPIPLDLWLCPTMWQKNKRARDEDAPPGQRLRHNILDLYGSGEVSAERTQELLEDAGEYAAEAGRDDFQDLRRRQSAGNERNIARDLRAKLLKHSHWPPVYEAHIRMWNTRTKEMGLSKVCVLLPHELLQALKEVGSIDILLDHSALDLSNQQRYATILSRLGEDFVGVSLWGDGVPFSWDRKRSADIWTMSLPGQSNKAYRDLRFTLTALPHERIVRESHDDLFEIFAWSFEALAHGVFPNRRHDGTEWAPSDKWRAKKAGEPLVHGAILELKGDWKHMAFCFSVPGWSSKPSKPICWRCDASKESLKTESGLESSWLQEDHRLDHYGALCRLVDDGGEVSPVFKIPWMSMSCLRLDWLHVVDQGIAPVFLGGVMHMVLADVSIGRNAEVRCRWLWTSIQEFYHREGVVDQLHDLTTTMIKPKKGSVELSGSGAQIRALIPWGKELVDGWVDCTVEQEAARACMNHLFTCYQYLSPTEAPREEDGFLINALGFQRNLQELHAVHPKRWQIRPKLHLFLEMALEGGHPSASWNYREESYGGSVSKQAHRKGGCKSPMAMSRAALTKFCAKERVPKLIAQDWLFQLAGCHKRWKGEGIELQGPACQRHEERNFTGGLLYSSLDSMYWPCTLLPHMGCLLGRC